MGFFNTLQWLIMKDYKIMTRNPLGLIFLLLFSVSLMLSIGIGFPGKFLEIHDIPILIVTLDYNNSLADKVTQGLAASGDFKVVRSYGSYEYTRSTVKSKKYPIGIYVPSENEQKNVDLYLFLDNSNQLIMEAASKSLQNVIDTISPTPLRFAQVDLFDVKLRYIDFLAPGIISMTIMFFCLNLTSGSIVVERLKGTLERNMVSPLPIMLLISGKYLFYLMFSLIVGALVLMSGIFFFHIVIRGSIIAIIVVELTTALFFLSLGLLLSSRGKSELEVHFQADTVALPMLILSGLFFPIESMPPLIQKMASLLPLTYSTQALRAIMLRGSTLSEVSFQLFIIILYTLPIILLTYLFFKKERG